MGFGNIKNFKIFSYLLSLSYFSAEKKNALRNFNSSLFCEGEDANQKQQNKLNNLSCCALGHKIGAYLAGLIEGDGTFAVHNKKSTAKKYSPMIIIVFKKADLPLAQYLQNLTKCGNVYLKPNRGYVLWQIQNISNVFTIVNLINGYMRTPKLEALNRTIDWLNE